ncbi:hypothetical protein FA95DRAFT_282892 [Auriscalpium vulgare]|uniref:Uncharacterized protein n=1 Tax=Auriscalpium vulgare TaxID=40419 RepID=A0ACB8S6G8_9AGAM|nr:hypothetical protein FA95DRAFT_282892 [Auriscalpium vulgare]
MSAGGDTRPTAHRPTSASHLVVDIRPSPREPRQPEHRISVTGGGYGKRRAGCPTIEAAGGRIRRRTRRLELGRGTVVGTPTRASAMYQPSAGILAKDARCMRRQREAAGEGARGDLGAQPEAIELGEQPRCLEDDGGRREMRVVACRSWNARLRRHRADSQGGRRAMCAANTLGRSGRRGLSAEGCCALVAPGAGDASARAH